jgi:fucose permease
MFTLRRFIVASLQQTSMLHLTLLGVPLLDEIIAGFLAIGLPLVSKQLRLDYTQVGLLFGIGALSSMVLDPFINLLSDRGSKRYWILGGLLILAAGFALAGTTHNFALLACSFALIFPAGSAALELSQATLIDHNPQESTRTMTRWTITSSIGDLLAPLIVPLLIILPSGWSKLCWLSSILWLGAACVIGLQRFPRPHPTKDDAHVPVVKLLDGLREALHDPVLLRWAVLSILPTMLDEVFVVYATFYLRDVVHIGPTLIGLLLAIHMIGAFLGLFVLDRILLGRIVPHHLLMGLALLVIAGMIGFLTLRAVWLTGLSLFVISLGTAGLYPIAKAQAYKRYPGRSGTVRAVISLGAPLEVFLPYIAGFVAGHFGVAASISMLGLAPFLVLLLVPKNKDCGV